MMNNENINGILVIDKPEGKSSGYIDFICKKILKTKKVGHIGTLDPFATGVLAIAINNGTKTIPYIKTERKIYEFEIKFGERTNTSDKTGEIIETSSKIPTKDEIKNIIPRFIGEISQKPSIFSAIKVNGRRAYELARKGENPDIKQRTITIFNLELIEEIPKPPIYKFRAEVSPGTYIRTLTEDIAKSLGTLGHTLSLRRIRDGKFSIDSAISLDALREKQDNIDSVLVSLENVLDDIPVILISCQDAENLLFGRCITTDFSGENGEYLASAKDGFLEIVDFSNGIISPKKLLRSNLKGE